LAKMWWKKGGGGAAEPEAERRSRLGAQQKSALQSLVRDKLPAVTKAAGGAHLWSGAPLTPEEHEDPLTRGNGLSKKKVTGGKGVSGASAPDRGKKGRGNGSPRLDGKARKRSRGAEEK